MDDVRMASRMTADRSRLLIVDDDAGVARLQQLRLERAGYPVTVARDLEEALQSLQSRDVLLMLLDQQVSHGRTGLGFYHEIRKSGLDVPTILVTGVSDETVAIDAFRTGVRDVLTKSLEYLDYLPEAVGRVLDQVRMEMRLADSEARLSGILNSATDAIVTVDEDFHITYVNSAAERMFDCTPVAAMGLPIADWIPSMTERDPPGQVRDWSQIVESGSPQRMSLAGQGRRTNGDVFRVEVELSPGEVLGRRFHTLLVRDVTERNRLEEALRQSQKMEAVGRLAGGVAHDFNNFLSVIVGYLELAQEQVPADSPLSADLRVIREAADQCAALTHQLLAFSRKLPLQPKVLNLSTVVAEMQKMLPRLLGDDVQLITELAPDPGTILGDPNQVKQVLLNLAVNARDAMPEGGRLLIETSAVTLPDARWAELEVPAGRYVLLSVADSGCGMDQSTLTRIFEPFFSTKAEGKGTGLGLATVFGIVKQSGGSIAVESHVGSGTTFRIFLPRIDDSTAPANPNLSDQSVGQGNGELVLLVDDKPNVRAFLRRMLEQHGYVVLEAGDAAEALNISDRYRGTIDLLLTDVIMPRHSGRYLADEVTGARPSTKVVYMSGHATDALLQHGLPVDPRTILAKPFTEHQLLEAIRGCLGVIR